MKLTYRLISLMCIVLVTGCASKVITYDVAGNTVGSCTSKHGFFSAANASCYGYSNIQSLRFSPPQMVLMPKQDTVVRPDSSNAPTSHKLPEIKSSKRLYLSPESEALPLIMPNKRIQIFNETPILK